MHAFRFHRLERFLDESALADQGYIGLGLLTPVKRKADVRMRATVRENNRLHSVVDRIIAQIKTWRVLHSGFRRPLSSYGRVFSSGAVAGVFRGCEPLMNKLPYE